MTEHLSTSGGCLCGAVRFEVTGQLSGFFLCHCKRCRKGSGTAHAANAFFTDATLDWLNGEGFVQTFQLPETRHRRSFCAKCGSPVPDYDRDGNFVLVPAGSIDGDFKQRPTAHIHYDDRADWEDNLQSIKKLGGAPG